jgi:hypothetical protein
MVGLHFFEHENADGDAGGVEQVRREADHSVDVAVFEPLGANLFFCTAVKEHAVRQDDGHHAFVFQEVKAVHNFA